MTHQRERHWRLANQALDAWDKPRIERLKVVAKRAKKRAERRVERFSEETLASGQSRSDQWR